jgi:N-acetylglutamate synthase-like GNAT family acetyltransferase
MEPTPPSGDSRSHGLRPLGDLAIVERMLAAAGLPSGDIAEPGRLFFTLASAVSLDGIVGLEPHGADALLRSLVVEEAARGRGVGTALVQGIADHARGLGVERLWLLTTTAPGFFLKLGFRPADRGRAPPAIRATAEFRDICPATASCLMRPI